MVDLNRPQRCLHLNEMTANKLADEVNLTCVLVKCMSSDI